MIRQREIGNLLQKGLIVGGMAKAKKTFKPFEHEDLELKNQLVDYARELAAKEEADAQLACAMIYASFTEYMASHLLDTLIHLMYETTYRDFAGIVYVDQRETGSIRTMGRMITQLQSYGFPDKKAIIELLDEISKSRNNLFHNFANTDEEGLEILNSDIQVIKEKTEELFTKINTIYNGLQKIILSPGEAGSLTDTPEPPAPPKAAKRKPKKSK